MNWHHRLQHSKHPAWMIARIIVGILLILLGILGLLLPLLPGIPFLVFGVILLVPNSRLADWLKALPHNIKSRFTRR